MAEFSNSLWSWYRGRHLLKEVAITFVIGAVLFLFLMLMFQAIRLSDFVIMHQVRPWVVMKLSLFLMTSFLPIALPIAFLFAVLMGVSRANSEGEILALQVNGLSLKQIYFPVGVASVILSLVCLVTSFYTVPKGNRGFEVLISQISNKRVIAAMKQGVFMESFYGLMVFSEKIIPQRQEMKRVFIYDERDATHPMSIVAREGSMRGSVTDGLTLRLSDGSIFLEKENPKGIQQVIHFNVYDINLDTSAKTGGIRAADPPSFTYAQLKEHIASPQSDLNRKRQLTVELHRRFSMAFSCIVFSILGFMIGIRSKKGIRGSAVVLCLGVGIVYWLSYLSSNALALGGYIAPWLAVWSPNIVFAAVPPLLFRRYAWT